MTLLGDGSGTLAYRVSIDGCPNNPVTHPEMAVGVYSPFPYRTDGLILRGEKFEATADPIACKLTVSSLNVKVADIGAAWSAIFDKAPQNTTWLTADVTSFATTIPVNSTSGFPAAGYIWVDSECIEYTSVNATNFLVCTRGVLSSDSDSATYHYVTDGTRQRSPEVTDWPVLWEGRRVRVFRYEESDLLTGDGTQCYLGVISTSPRFDGKIWSFTVDPIASILNQMLGSDLSEAVYPRGIYYSPANPWSATFYKAHDAPFPLSPAGPTGLPAPVRLAGFFEDQEAWCRALTTAIQASTALYWLSTSQVVTAVSDGPSGWHLQYTTSAGANARAVSIDSGNGSAIDHSMGQGNYPQNIDGSVATFVVAETTYYFFPAGLRAVATGSPPGLGATGANVVVPNAGSVPRGSLRLSGSDAERTLYLGGSSPISSFVGAASVDMTGLEQTEHSVQSADAGTRSIVLRTMPEFPRPWYYFSAGDLPEVRFGLLLTTDPDGTSVYDLIQRIITSQSQYSTLGVCPMLRANDVDSANWYITAVAGQPELVTRRYFSTFAPIALMDIVRPELQLAGCFLSINATGQLVPKRIRLAVASELSATATVGQTTLLTDDLFVSHEIAGLGQVNQTLLRTGYNAREDKWSGRQYITRDVPSFGQSPTVRQVAIEPKSEYRGSDITEDDVVQMSAGYFGAFGGAYAVDTMDVALHGDVSLGDPLAFEHPHLPDETGVLGLTGAVGLVISRSQEAYSPRVRVSMLTTRQKLGGYAPSAQITFWTLVTGNEYTLLLNTATLPAANGWSGWFAVGDRVKRVQFDTSSTTPVAGTITGTSVTTVTVLFDSPPGTPTAYLTMADSTDASLATTQRRFTSVAASDGIVDYASNDKPAFRMGA